MDLTLRSINFSQDRKDWLGSQHGTDAPRSVTLDVSTFTQATHYPDGYIKSGLPLGKITATGKYGLYDNTKSNGQEVCAGLLATGVEVINHRGQASTTVGGSMLVHGFVVLSKLPAPGLDTAGQADVASRIYPV